MVFVSPGLVAHCRQAPERMAWLERLPRTVAEIEARWQLSVGPSFEEGDASWVAPAVLRDGSHAVLKLGMPHFEAASEADGLRFWNGNPTVHLHDADDELGAMLLERCEPGSSLARVPEPEQDIVLAGLLRRMWKPAHTSSSFRPLSAMIEAWISETWEQRAEWPDESLVGAGIATFRELSSQEKSPMLLATDLHAGNVLRAAREPWLVIDPKPFVGDPAYDATQHLLNCEERMSRDPFGTMARYAGLLGLDADRVRDWMFARLAAEPREHWAGDPWLEIAKAISVAR